MSSSSSDRVLNVVMGVLAVCALAVTGLLVRREVFAPPRLADSPAPLHVANWKEYATAGHVIGPVSAPVTIVEFADFQCPYCGTLYQRLALVRQRYPSQTRIVFRHYPLERLHPFALQAAIASECAAQQGRFERYYSELFGNQSVIGVKSWEEFAKNAGVGSISSFRACFRSGREPPEIAADISAGDRLQVGGTPTILINDLRMEGAPELSTLDSLVDIALRAPHTGE